jgi:hypothetical protein
MESAKDYRKGAKIHLQGLGIRNRHGKLLRIESIESSSVLEPLDIHARLEELRQLKEASLLHDKPPRAVSPPEPQPRFEAGPDVRLGAVHAERTQLP